MTSRQLETGVGLFAALGFAALTVLALKVSNLTSFTDEGGYEIRARFDNIGSLKVRAPVSMAGVRIGKVSEIEFDPDTYEAVVTMRIDRRYARLPVDTTAGVFTSGLLGEQYVGLDPGAEERYLGAADEITHTQSALVLEHIIGQFIFSQGQGGGGWQ